MKLIKIGSASNNDIVLHSSFVSAHHAEITILDNGEIVIEDKNSTNGTFLGNKRLTPNSETPIRRGDLIRFADTDLVWARIPSAPNLTGYDAVVNIGSNFRNEIVVNSGVVSRYHATVFVKGNKAFIRDNNSKNGTQVNGAKIPAGRDYPIKKGYNVMCAGEDITQELQPYLPNSKPVLPILGGVAAIVLLAILLYLVFPPFERPDYTRSVVYVEGIYKLKVEFKDNPMPEIWDGTYTFPLQEIGYTGTAFFIDREGHLATNAHIARPWDNEKEVINTLRFWLSEFTDKINNESDLSDAEEHLLLYLYNIIYNYSGQNSEKTLNNIGKILPRLIKSPVEVFGEFTSLRVGYPGQYYTDHSQLSPCNVIAVSDNPEIDVAIIQLNNHKTPDDIKDIIDINDIPTKKIEPLKEELITIGYPRGKRRGMDESTKSLKPTQRKTVCSKEPGRYIFEMQESSVGGSSGSPILNDEGQLVGLLFGGYDNEETHAVHAKFLKEMYDKEVNY